MSRKLVAGFLFAAFLSGVVLGSAITLDNGSDPPDEPLFPGGLGNDSGYATLYNATIDSVVSIHTGNGSVSGSQGSGFVYDSSGHIVTNQHVVAGRDTVDIRFSRGDWRVGRVVGTDIYTDLAVVRVDDLPGYVDPLPVADQDPRRGVRVAALGNPLGLEGSISHGIVSGVNRSMRTANNFAIPDMVQTDAPVNPGNSGGPLVTMEGQVVGVNRATQGDNIGFAVSADLVNMVVPELVRTGSVDHAYLGVRTRGVTPFVADVNNVDPGGVLVVDVLEGGPSSGVLEPSTDSVSVEGESVPVGGDIILSIEGTSIDSNQDLANFLITRTRPGEEIDITVLRDGERRTVEVRLGERPPP